MNAVGRTINTRFDLDKNYRNTREIMRVAAEFVSPNAEQPDPELGLQIVRPNPDIALRSGPAPEMLTASTLEDELKLAVRKILAWQEEGRKGQISIEPSRNALSHPVNSERLRISYSAASRPLGIYSLPTMSGPPFKPQAVRARIEEPRLWRRRGSSLSWPAIDLPAPSAAQRLGAARSIATLQSRRGSPARPLQAVLSGAG